MVTCCQRTWAIHLVLENTDLTAEEEQVNGIHLSNPDLVMGGFEGDGEMGGIIKNLGITL